MHLYNDLVDKTDNRSITVIENFCYISSIITRHPKTVMSKSLPEISSSMKPEVSEPKMSTKTLKFKNLSSKCNRKKLLLVLTLLS